MNGPFMMIYDDSWWFMMIHDDLSWFMMIYLLNMVIVHSYVKLPEGTVYRFNPKWQGPQAMKSNLLFIRELRLELNSILNNEIYASFKPTKWIKMDQNDSKWRCLIEPTHRWGFLNKRWMINYHVVGKL